MSFAALLNEGFEILVEKKAKKPAPKTRTPDKGGAALKHMVGLLKGRKVKKGHKIEDLASWILRQLGGRHSRSQEEGRQVESPDVAAFKADIDPARILIDKGAAMDALKTMRSDAVVYPWLKTYSLKQIASRLDGALPKGLTNKGLKEQYGPDWKKTLYTAFALFKAPVQSPSWDAAWELVQDAAGKSAQEETGLEESDQDVAKTILMQMGGVGKIKAMTGARNFTSSEDGVSFQWPGKGGGPNAVRITLTPEDTYTVEFIRAGKGGPKVVSKHEDIYAEDLKELFEKQTGLALSL